MQTSIREDREERAQLLVYGVPRDLIADLDRVARLHDRSRASEIRVALREHVRQVSERETLAGTAV
jgi:hypothetical protein